MKTVVHAPSKDKAWTKQPDDSWVCDRCGTPIASVTQMRSVWLSDGPGPCAGTGEVEQHIVPFCPLCDPKPSRTGVTFKTIAESIIDNLY